MSDKAELLRWISSASEHVLEARLRQWLESSHTTLLSDRVPKKTVSELIHLWKTRLANTSITRVNLEGAELFLNRLGELRPQQKVEQYALNGETSSGSLFFLRSNHEFVGAVLVQAEARHSE